MLGQSKEVVVFPRDGGDPRDGGETHIVSSSGLVDSEKSGAGKWKVALEVYSVLTCLATEMLLLIHEQRRLTM